MPPAEVMLWRRLKGKQIAGLKFRQHSSVEKYSLDFYCPQVRLAIEIDGDTHVDQARDQSRQQFWKGLGFDSFAY